MFCSRLRLPLRALIGRRSFARSKIKLSDSLPKKDEKIRETENRFSHRVLENFERYNLRPEGGVSRENVKVEDLNLSEIPWKILSRDELCRLFTTVSLSASTDGSFISDSKYNDMCSSVASRCGELNNSQLQSLLTALANFPMCSSVDEPNFFYIWKAIDNALVPRIKDLNAEKILRITDLWYHLHLTRRSDFVYHALNRIANRPKRLRSEQVVLLLFYQNVIRTLSKNVKMFPVVERFGEVVHDLTIEEIGVACMGFFKTENPISLVEVVDAIISKLINNADTVQEITLASIMKALRYKLPITLWHRIPELMNTLVPQVDRLSVTSAVHIPLILTGSHTIHKPILDAVAEKLIQEIDNARLKDIEKVIYPLVLLNYNPNTSQCIFQAAANQLDRPERLIEFNTWPKCLIAILHYLVIRGIFVDHLISRVLDMNFIKTTYGKNNYMIGREVLFIDSSMKMENQHYLGNLLPDEVSNYLSKRYSAYIPDATRSMSKQLQFEYDVIQTANRLTGRLCKSKYLLPNHPRADLVVRFDNLQGEFLPLPEAFASIPDFTGPIPCPGNDYWALIPLSRNLFIRNLDGLTGETLAKERQLKILGFKPLFVLEKSWPAEGTDAEKEDHLKNLISTQS